MPDANPQAFKLHDFLPYLMARVGSLTALSFTPDLKRAGITLDMWRVLMVLNFNGPQTLVDLAGDTGVKTPTLSRLVGRMVQKGLLSRRRSKTDTRTVQVSLRRKGEALFERLWPTASGLEELVLSPLSAKQVSELKNMLRAIEGTLVDHIEADPGQRREVK